MYESFVDENTKIPHQSNKEERLESTLHRLHGHNNELFDQYDIYLFVNSLATFLSSPRSLDTRILLFVFHLVYPFPDCDI